MGTLLLIRHGQASYGEADYDRLSARGEQQARAVGDLLARYRPTATFAGPLRRQQQTIELARAAREHAIPAPTTLPELAEYPAFEMLQHLVPRLVADDPKFAALTSAPTPRLLDDAFHTILGRWSRDEWLVPGVERVDDFVARVRGGLDRILARSEPGARLVAVTSAGPIGVALGLVFGIPPERMIRTSITVRNASATGFRFRSTAFADGHAAWNADAISLVTFNVTAHLPDELTTER